MSIFKKLLWVAYAFVFCSLSVSVAKADVITFEGHPNDGAVVQDQDGFRFTFNANGWGIFQNDFVGNNAPYTSNGTTRLVASGDKNNTTAFVDITPLDGLAFSFSGFDSATMFPGFKGNVQVIGQLSGGGSVFALFDVSDQFASFVMPVSFANLTSVRVRDAVSGSFGREPGFSLDNLRINESAASVPEPTTMLLFGTGLAGIGGMVRRRRQGKGTGSSNPS